MTCWKTCLHVLKCIFIAQVLFSLFHIVEDMSISKTCLKYGTKTRFLQWSLHFQTLHLTKSVVYKIQENSENYYHGIWHFTKLATLYCWWHWKPVVSPYIIWSLHTLFDKYVDPCKSYGPSHAKFCTLWQKMVSHFWQKVDVILEDVSMTETIVWCWTIFINL